MHENTGNVSRSFAVFYKFPRSTRSWVKQGDFPLRFSYRSEHSTDDFLSRALMRHAQMHSHAYRHAALVGFSRRRKEKSSPVVSLSTTLRLLMGDAMKALFVMENFNDYPCTTAHSLDAFSKVRRSLSKQLIPTWWCCFNPLVRQFVIPTRELENLAPRKNVPLATPRSTFQRIIIWWLWCSNKFIIVRICFIFPRRRRSELWESYALCVVPGGKSVHLSSLIA